MNATMKLDTVADLALRVAAVRDSVALPGLESTVEELGERRRYDAGRWYLGTASSSRTIARDLVRTEEEREICQGCPVRDRCLSLAVLTGDTDDSIHGGLLPVQQREVGAALQQQGNGVVLRLPSRVEAVPEPRTA
ncbi:WhiB family transcriptional regulator [Streptomyces sp. H27-G5]|uniref:WhiB family transcriptional regulator n=1 Tax=Streptomyces sp. H27-G5 TaxID=2996698 RepID=UPI0022711364|nr:WhiB family transcriptional regulator [Streptomyces sp. H27-G5]MCY0924429.1 WhiB family transcriptional regulator [Streptomyces sp. H27-G5]